MVVLQGSERSLPREQPWTTGLVERSHTPAEGDATDELPTAVRTFLIADVRGYTRFTQNHGDEAAAQLAAKFASLTRERVSSRGGRVIELRGDEALCVFSSARQALRCSVELQADFAAETAREPALPFPVGIGLDAGEAVPVEGGYRGGALNLAARLCSHAQAGEILASETVMHLARRIAGVAYQERGPVQLKGLADPVRIVYVTAEAESPVTPAPFEDTAEAPGASVAQPAMPPGGFLGARPEARLVGRQGELRSIIATVAAVAGGSGRLVMLTGEPGVGKTRLAQEVSLELRSRGFLVAAASCHEQRQAVPFHPYLEALVSLYQACPAPTRQQSAERWPSLGRLLPGEVFPSDTPEGDEDQERLFRAVANFLLEVAKLAPVALLIDDVQWADRSSLELLRYLARQTRGARVLLLGVYRDNEVGWEHPLEGVVLDLNRHQLVDWIHLRPFSQEETAQLVATTMGEMDVVPELAVLLHRRAEGNPYYAQEMLRSMVERGKLHRRDGRWVGSDLNEIQVPARLRAVVDQRLSRLSDGARSLVREASVLGQTFTFDHLHAMSGRGEDELERLLEEAVQADIVREVGGDGYAFSHTITRETIYEELPARRRRRLHLAAGRALEQVSGPSRARHAAELAWHFLQGDDAARGLTYTLMAGDQAEAVLAHGEAERHYRAALEVARAQQDLPGEAQILEKLGGVLDIVGRYDEALQTLERAVQLLDAAGDAEGQNRVVAHIGSIYARTGRPEEGLARLQGLFESTELTPSSPARARVLTAQAQLLIAAGRPGEALSSADRAVALARATGDARTQVEAEMRRGEALAMLGDYEQARHVLEGVIARQEGIDQGMFARALYSVSIVALLAGQFQQARAYQERSLELAEQLGDPRSTVAALAALSQTLIYVGEWEEAQVLLDRAGARARSVALATYADQIQTLAGYLLLLQGDWEQASRLLEEVERSAQDRYGRRDLWSLQACLAERDLLAGRFDACRSRLEPLLDKSAVEPADSGELMLSLAEAQLGLGQTDRAEQTVERGLARSGPTRNRPAFLKGLWLRGRIRARQERWEEAGRLFEAGLSLARSMPYPFFEGRLLHEYGLINLRTENQAQAREQMGQARAIFERLGAKKHALWALQAVANGSAC